MKIAESHADENISDLVFELGNLAALHQDLAIYDQAEDVSSAASFWLTRGWWKQYPLSATARSNQASILQSTGDYAEALSLAQEALKIREQVLGPDHPDTISSLNNLALLFLAMGDRIRP